MDAANPDEMFKKFEKTLHFAISLKELFKGEKIIIYLDEINKLKHILQDNEAVSYIR